MNSKTHTYRVVKITRANGNFEYMMQRRKICPPYLLLLLRRTILFVPSLLIGIILDFDIYHDLMRNFKDVYYYDNADKAIYEINEAIKLDNARFYAIKEKLADKKRQRIKSKSDKKLNRILKREEIRL